jgi:hypothetical protein
MSPKLRSRSRSATGSPVGWDRPGWVRVVGQLGEPWLGQRLHVQRGHYTVLQPPQVSRLAAVLRDVLGD